MPLKIDLDKIRSVGHFTTVIMAVTNMDELNDVELIGENAVQSGDDIKLIPCINRNPFKW